MKLFLIVSREQKYLIQAENRKEAYARFFLQVKRGQIGVGELGQIILCYSATEADPYPFLESEKPPSDADNNNNDDPLNDNDISDDQPQEPTEYQPQSPEEHILRRKILYMLREYHDTFTSYLSLIHI